MWTNPDTGEMLASPFIRSAYNYSMDKASEDSGIEFKEPSLTKQAFAEEADINTIVRRFGLTGELPDGLQVPESGDFVNALNYHESMNVIRKAEESFMELPAEVRARFRNDPGEFMDFVHKKENLEEARKLGIAMPAPAAPVEPPPMKVLVVEPEGKKPSKDGVTS